MQTVHSFCGTAYAKTEEAGHLTHPTHTGCEQAVRQSTVHSTHAATDVVNLLLATAVLPSVSTLYAQNNQHKCQKSSQRSVVILGYVRRANTLTKHAPARTHRHIHTHTHHLMCCKINPIWVMTSTSCSSRFELSNPFCISLISARIHSRALSTAEPHFSYSANSIAHVSVSKGGLFG